MATEGFQGTFWITHINTYDNPHLHTIRCSHYARPYWAFRSPNCGLAGKAIFQMQGDMLQVLCVVEEGS